MANPQLEEGHTRIANELLEALVKASLGGGEWEIIMCVIRKTYGFQKKEDWISYTSFEKMTGKSRCNIWRNIAKLVAKKILVAKKQPGKTFYGFNKDYSRWVVAETQLVAKMQRASCENATQLVARTQPTKETITKETITKEKYKSDSNEFRLAVLLANKILENNPSHKFSVMNQKEFENKMRSWCKHMDLIMRVDGRSYEQVEVMIKWCQQDSFWQANILSAQKLREKFDTLIAQCKRGGNKNGIVKIS